MGMIYSLQLCVNKISGWSKHRILDHHKTTQNTIFHIKMHTENGKRKIKKNKKDKYF